MAASSVAPSLYSRAVTDTMVFRPGRVLYHRVLQTERSHPALEHDAHADWNELSKIFPPRSHIMPYSPYGKPMRLEFFWDEGKLESGVAVFDADRKLIVHSLNALLGTADNIRHHSGLSSKLLRRLGVDELMIEHVHRSVQNSRHYLVIVSQETDERRTRRGWWWHRMR